MKPRKPRTPGRRKWNNLLPRVRIGGLVFAGESAHMRAWKSLVVKNKIHKPRRVYRNPESEPIHPKKMNLIRVSCPHSLRETLSLLFQALIPSTGWYKHPPKQFSPSTEPMRTVHTGSHVLLRTLNTCESNPQQAWDEERVPSRGTRAAKSGHMRYEGDLIRYMYRPLRWKACR